MQDLIKNPHADTRTKGWRSDGNKNKVNTGGESTVIEARFIAEGMRRAWVGVGGITARAVSGSELP